MILVIITAMCACLAIGAYIGHVLTLGEPAPARHAPPAPLRVTLVPRDPDTGDLIALNAAETARFPALPAAQPPLGELVQPRGERAERATDFIERMQADTDRFIWAMRESAR